MDEIAQGQILCGRVREMSDAVCTTHQLVSKNEDLDTQLEPTLPYKPLCLS